MENQLILTHREKFGEFATLNIEGIGTHPWTFLANGGFMSSTNAGAHNSKSQVKINFATEKDNAKIEIDYRVDSQLNYDKIRFYIDNETEFYPESEYTHSGQNVRQTITLDIENAGDHYVIVSYEKNETISSFTDQAQIREFRIYEWEEVAEDVIRLKDVPLGNKLMTKNIMADGTESELFWDVVSKRHHELDKDYPKDAVTLLSDKVIDYERYNYSRTGWTSYTWVFSDIRNVLNENFYNSFPDEIKNNMAYTFIEDGQTSSTRNIRVDKIFLPSLREIFGNNPPSGGSSSLTQLGVAYDQRTDRYTPAIPEAIDRYNYLTNFEKLSYDGFLSYWTREQNMAGTAQGILFHQVSQGMGTSIQRGNPATYHGIRPVFNISSDTEVFQHPDYDDVYSFEYVEDIYNRETLNLTATEPERESNNIRIPTIEGLGYMNAETEDVLEGTIRVARDETIRIKAFAKPRTDDYIFRLNNPEDVWTFEYIDPTTIPDEPVEKKLTLTHRETYEGSILFNYRNDSEYPWIFNFGNVQSGNKDIDNSRSSLFWRIPTIEPFSRIEIDISAVAERRYDRLEIYVVDALDTPRYTVQNTTDMTTIVIENGRTGDYELEFRFITDDTVTTQENMARIHEIRISQWLYPEPFTEGDISNLPLGAKIKMGENSDGEDLLFSVVSKEHHYHDNNYPENAVTLMSDYSVTDLRYHSDGTYHVDYYWSYSSIRTWLNNIFYNSLDSSIQNVILTTGVEYGDDSWAYDTTSGVTQDKIFIPSTAEIGLFEEEYAGGFNQPRGTYFDYYETDIGHDYWLRDPYYQMIGGTEGEFIHQYVDENGQLQMIKEDSPRGTRPIFNVQSTARVRKVHGTDYFEFDIIDDSDNDYDFPDGLKNNYIYVINPETLEVEKIVDNYESVSMTINYNSVGDFILQIENRLENAKYMSKGKIILYGGDGRFVGIVTNIDLSIDEEGNNIKVIRGKSLGQILSYRVIEVPNPRSTGKIRYTGRAEDMMKEIVNMNFVDTNENRKVDNFGVANSKGLGEFIYGDFLFDNVLEVIEETAQSQNLGWHVVYNEISNSMVFDVYQGRNLSTEQEENDPVVLSVDLGNLESQSYLYDEFGNKNYVYAEVYSSLWSDALSTWEEKGEDEVKGINRKESYTKIDVYRPDLISPTNPDYSVPADLQMDWFLDSHKPLESFDGKILDKQIFEFGKDYDIGDIVTIRNNDWGVEADLRIVSATIESSADGSDFDIILTFGEKIPRITDRIKNEIKEYDRNHNDLERTATVQQLREVERRLRNNGF